MTSASRRTDPPAADDAIEGARCLVFDLGRLRQGERVCVVSDPTTWPIGELLAHVAGGATGRVQHLTVAPAPMHGTEPPAAVAQAMRESDLVLGITSKSMAHTQARVRACEGGTRYLSLPEYDWDLIRHPALRIDYERAAVPARIAADALTSANEIRVISPAGTDITMDATGRVANFCPGFVDADHRLGSPPDIEANISPVEESSRGVAVIDGSIAYPGFGRLDQPIRLTIRSGSITAIDGDAGAVRSLETLFGSFPTNARVLAEFGIGFNPAAELCGNMLMDEGCYGTFHFGFGSNATVGGKNSVPFHVDFVFRANEFFVDGRSVHA